MEKDFQNNQIIEYVYIHIPFCLKKCNYCSFYTTNFKISEKKSYINTIIKEISIFQKKFNILPKTIYFGGGTPSLLKAEELNIIIDMFNLSNIKEITLEANPITLTQSYIKQLSKTKINRISLGIQSMIDEELQLLGRLHKQKQIPTIIKLLKENGFKNISFDLIYALPNQKLSDVEYSLYKMIELEPKHISIYCLSLEKDVPIYKLKNKLPTDETTRKMYYTIRKILIKTNYKHYELSNFSKIGYESIHNLSYWNLVNYLGIGVSAAGYINGKRYQNPLNIQNYKNQITFGNIMPSAYKLANKEKQEEFLFLGLRKIQGIKIQDFIKNFGEKSYLFYKKKLLKYIQTAFLIEKNGFLKLSPKAYFVSNEIFSDIL